MLDKLPNKGDYIRGSGSNFDMRDVSVLSKETGVEFARVTIGNETFFYSNHFHSSLFSLLYICTLDHSVLPVPRLSFYYKPQ